MKSIRFMSLVGPLKWLMAATMGFVLVTCGGDGKTTTARPQAQTTRTVSMSGEQEVPPVSHRCLGNRHDDS